MHYTPESITQTPEGLYFSDEFLQQLLDRINTLDAAGLEQESRALLEFNLVAQARMLIDDQLAQAGCHTHPSANTLISPLPIKKVLLWAHYPASIVQISERQALCRIFRSPG